VIVAGGVVLEEVEDGSALTEEEQKKVDEAVDALLTSGLGRSK
jgi:hypothetical protein